jgi:hypothetical protein
MERIQLDNDRSYFLSGEVDKLIYDEQCVFADRDRIVEKLANLGSVITKCLIPTKMVYYRCYGRLRIVLRKVTSSGGDVWNSSRAAQSRNSTRSMRQSLE